MLGTDISSFKNMFAKVNSSIHNANTYISSLFQRNSDITNLNTSVVNLSLNFLEPQVWALTPLLVALTNLSTSFWIDNERSTQNINKLTSVSTVGLQFYRVMTH